MFPASEEICLSLSINVCLKNSETIHILELLVVVVFTVLKLLEFTSQSHRLFSNVTNYTQAHIPANLEILIL